MKRPTAAATGLVLAAGLLATAAPASALPNSSTTVSPDESGMCGTGSTYSQDATTEYWKAISVCTVRSDHGVTAVVVTSPPPDEAPGVSVNDGPKGDLSFGYFDCQRPLGSAGGYACTDTYEGYAPNQFSLSVDPLATEGTLHVTTSICGQVDIDVHSDSSTPLLDGLPPFPHNAMGSGVGSGCGQTFTSWNGDFAWDPVNVWQ